MSNCDDKVFMQVNISSRFSRNSEANASEFLENREEMFPQGHKRIVMNVVYPFLKRVNSKYYTTKKTCLFRVFVEFCISDGPCKVNNNKFI